MGCRYNTYLNVNARGQVRLQPSRRAVEPLGADAASSCALDMAEGGPRTQTETGVGLGLTQQAVEKLEHQALEKLRETHPELLRALLEQMASGGPVVEASVSELFGDDDDRDANTEDTSHAGALTRKAVEREDVGRWTDAVLAGMRDGLRMAQAWTRANEEDAMVTKTKKNKGPKLGAKANGKPSKPPTAPKVGDASAVDGEVMIGKPFAANHPVPIDPVRRDRVSEELVEVLGEIDVVNEEKSAANGGFNLKLKELKEKQHELAEAHRTSTEKQAVKCALFLLPGNEVVTRRLDTNEIVERRTAKAEELQVEAFQDQASP